MNSGLVVWITGLPSSGKSTFASALFARLRDCKVSSCVLDSDSVRSCLVPSPGYSETDRAHFYQSLGQLAALLANQGLVVVVPATANRRSYREQARQLAPAFQEVFLNVPAEECRQRDAKGLYRAQATGTLARLPGADLQYEAPASADVVARGGQDPEALEQTLERILHRAKSP